MAGECMSAIVPMGYTRKRIGIFLAIVVVVGAGVSISIFLANGASFADVKYLCIGAIVLALLCMLSDVTTNLRNKKKREHREKMLLCPAVKGHVTEVRRIPFYFGREVKENAHIYVSEKNCVYRLVVVFSHPVTGKEETIVSERYSSNVEAYLKEGCVNVHYSEKGEHWVEI